jgi:hypothetical protein
VGVQIPTWDARAIDLDQASRSKAYCDKLVGRLRQVGLEVTELTAHLQGQVLAMHPAYEVGFQPFYPSGLDAKGAREGASFVARHLIEATPMAFDDFAGAKTDSQRNRRMLGLA